MICTVRFAHLEQPPMYAAGDKITEGSFIGRMGNTGQSTAAHLHLDVVSGEVRKPWSLHEAESGKVFPQPWELNKFLNMGLFNALFRITTHYCDRDYQVQYGKLHTAYDVSTDKEWPWSIYWPIMPDGKVTFSGDAGAYGYCLMASFDTEEKQDED